MTATDGDGRRRRTGPAAAGERDDRLREVAHHLADTADDVARTFDDLADTRDELARTAGPREAEGRRDGARRAARFAAAERAESTRLRTRWK